MQKDKGFGVLPMPTLSPQLGDVLDALMAEIGRLACMTLLEKLLDDGDHACGDLAGARQERGQ